MRLSDSARQLIGTLQWKGNVRELQNLLEGVVQLYPEGEILPEHILENMRSVSAFHWEQRQKASGESSKDHTPDRGGGETEPAGPP